MLINASPSPPFNNSQGIGQGYPLFPFIFVLMEEGLRRTLKETVNSRNLQGQST
jgi:hypothetical protein